MTDEEFIKLAYATGRVKDASEAFEEYPPEEEGWHEVEKYKKLYLENMKQE